MKYYFRLLFVMFAVFLFISCSSVQSVKDAKGKGEIQTYAASLSEIWTAMPEVLKEINAFDIEEHRSENFIYGKIPMTVAARINSLGMAHDRKIAIFIESISDKKTKVEVVCEQLLAGARIRIGEVHWALDKKFSRVE
jgi:uncharacterized protein YceK